MKIIIAPGAFKGSLTARQAALAIERGVRAVLPDAEMDLLPMADGGEGTLDALVHSTNGTFVNTEVFDPLNRAIHGVYGILGDGKTAVIEMASASGLLLLSEEEKNPLHTTTYGTGQLMYHALESGYRNFLICIGGSSTNDCGTGMAQALGVQFFETDEIPISHSMSGSLLEKVARLTVEKIHPAIRESHFIAAADVRNPLLGENGCAMVYSPQKGATPDIVQQLEHGMRSFIDIAEGTIGKSVRDVPGAGAAGGLGAGLMLFLNAELRPGIELVLDSCNFSERIRQADLILTGEGKIDRQTAYGKVIAGIAQRAQSGHVPVIAFGGIVEHADELLELGITSIHTIRDEGTPIEESMKQASTYLQDAVTRVLRQLALSRFSL